MDTFPLRLALALALALQGGCQGHAVRRFPLAAPLWNDPDRNPVPRRPAKYFSGLYTGGFEESVLRPLIDPLALPLPGEAVNVNAVDEVPDSSWFEDRIGRRPLSPREAALGSCQPSDLEGLRGPWQVTSSKDEGLTPGFFVRARGGQRYLFKLDDPKNQPERASAADVVVSRLYHALGYFTPCNQVVTFRPEELVLASDATFENDRGLRRHLTRERLAELLGKGLRLRDGRLRALASRLLPGEPLGPHPARGVRGDDPNDVVPHEDRRELRAERLLVAWVGHFDTREENSLDAWVEEGGRRFVRHYQLDFGDSFGGEWAGADRLNRSVGHGHYWDLGQIFTDLLSLGAVRRPWYGPWPRPGGAIFGYFGWSDLQPSRWRSITPHPAYERMTWRDALWMVRGIVRLSDEHLRAVVREARLSDPDAERYLLQALIERRDRIAAEYLGRHVPLAEATLQRSPGGASRLCFADLGVRHGVVDPARVVYAVRLLAGERLEQVLGAAQLRPRAGHPDSTCLPLPLAGLRPQALAPRGAPDAHPLRYAVVEITVRRPGVPPGTLRTHLYDLGPARGFVLVGVERR